MEAGLNGVSANTPKNTLFGAGTIHKNLAYTNGTGWNFSESIIGATNGGSKLTITPEFFDIPVDGINFPVKELKKKIGETAEMEINFSELTKDIIKSTAIGKDGTSDDENYDLIVSNSKISSGDFFTNIAFVGKTLDDRNVIAILENALCTSGFGAESKSNEGAVFAYTFSCHATVSNINDGVLPWKIYYPKPAV